jgi:hypothetical protein
MLDFWLYGNILNVHLPNEDRYTERRYLKNWYLEWRYIEQPNLELLQHWTP